MLFSDFTFGAWYVAQLRFIIEETEEYHRECRNPGSDISDLPQEAQDQINAVWTPEVIEAFNSRPLEGPESLQPAPPKSVTPKQQRLLREAREAEEAGMSELEREIETLTQRVAQ